MHVQLTSSTDIAEAHMSQITAISIPFNPQNAALGHLPPLTLMFSELKVLSLVGTSLVHIPFNLCELKHLEVGLNGHLLKLSFMALIVSDSPADPDVDLYHKHRLKHTVIPEGC